MNLPIDRSRRTTFERSHTMGQEPVLSDQWPLLVSGRTIRALVGPQLTIIDETAIRARVHFAICAHHRELLVTLGDLNRAEIVQYLTLLAAVDLLFPDAHPTYGLFVGFESRQHPWWLLITSLIAGERSAELVRHTTQAHPMSDLEVDPEVRIAAIEATLGVLLHSPSSILAAIDG